MNGRQGVNLDTLPMTGIGRHKIICDRRVWVGWRLWFR